MAEKAAKKPEKPGMPRWKKLMIAGAVVLIVIGAGLKLAGMAARKPEPPPPASTGPGAGGLSQPLVAESQRRDPGQPEAGGRPEERTLPEEISPFFLQGGLSFFVGLAIGTAVRAVFKVALVIAGVILLGVFALSYFGAIGPIDWASLEDWLSVHLKDAGEKTAPFRDYILASLPSAALAGAGLVTGFRRK